MHKHTLELERAQDLRLQAVARLQGREGATLARDNASKALTVLYGLASSPSTSADALALLHELQVHQVELELQDEELRRSCAELEAALERQTQLYDLAPVACYTVTHDTVLCEMNLTGATLLGEEREALLGRALEEFLAPASRGLLLGLLQRVGTHGRRDGCTLELASTLGTAGAVLVSAGADPAAGRFMVAIAFGEHGSPPPAP